MIIIIWQKEILDKCPACGDYKVNSKTHKCNLKQMSYYQKKLCKKHNMVSVRTIEKPKIKYDDVIHFDLETFQESIKHVPYACGWYKVNINTPMVNCIDQFLMRLLRWKIKLFQLTM